MPMQRLIVVDMSKTDLEEIRNKSKELLKKLKRNETLILMSEVDISYLFRGYEVEKAKEEGMWIISVRRN
ncbi:hypothetical protein KN1_16400 [Stygiolobus caldivivus]|uniref:Uncharacterized protein n=2 Tax=Stygiolobus caldivivus TaxID=2824673 RepID=A0A8D5U7F4_9CREN|nr:hypothetical protein KN1_16400 [Stygiolobus caldivivus]